MSNNAEDPRVKELADLFNQLPDAERTQSLTKKNNRFNMQNEEQRTAARRVIGALAQDIRNCYTGAVDERIQVIHELAETFALEDVPEIPDADRRRIWMDGRYFRDEWSGPYGDCSTSDLELIGEKFGMFLMPAEVISDYVPLRRDYWTY